MRTLTILFAALTLALAGVGCGGGDEDASGDTDTIAVTETDETTTEDTTTADTTTEPAGGDDDTFDFGSEECQDLVEAYVAAARSLGAGAAGATSDVSEYAEVFARFADRAPEEIRADLRLLAEAYTEYADVLADAGLEPGEIPSAEQAQELQGALQSVGSADVAAAGQRVSAWAQANC